MDTLFERGLRLNHGVRSRLDVLRTIIEFDSMKLDLTTFRDQIERGSPPGARINDRAGKRKPEKRTNLSCF